VTQAFYLPTGAERPEVIGRIGRILSSLAPEKRWKVEIEEHKPKRTDAQNRYLWGVCYSHILREGGEQLAGWRAEDLHEFFLGECYGWTVVQGFGAKRKRPIRRSSRMNKQEFSDYVGYIQQRAAELGITIPDAGDFLG
jgi:hypothetical protein